MCPAGLTWLDSTKHKRRDRHNVNVPLNWRNQDAFRKQVRSDRPTHLLASCERRSQRDVARDASSLTLRHRKANRQCAQRRTTGARTTALCDGRSSFTWNLVKHTDTICMQKLCRAHASRRKQIKESLRPNLSEVTRKCFNCWWRVYQVCRQTRVILERLTQTNMQRQQCERFTTPMTRCRPGKVKATQQKLMQKWLNIKHWKHDFVTSNRWDALIYTHWWTFHQFSMQ